MTSRRTIAKWILCASIAATLPTSVHGQRRTIPEMIAAGVPGRFRTTPSGGAPEVIDILRMTDLIVRGIVGQPRAYLSADQFDVHSDYPIVNPAIMFATSPITSSTPGLPTIIATQLGGTLQLGGVSFTQTEDGIAPLESGTEVLLLLTRTNDKLRIARTFYGAFQIRDGKLTPLSGKHGFATEYRDMNADEAIRRLVQQKRALR